MKRSIIIFIFLGMSILLTSCNNEHGKTIQTKGQNFVKNYAQGPKDTVDKKINEVQGMKEYAERAQNTYLNQH